MREVGFVVSVVLQLETGVKKKEETGLLGEPGRLRTHKASGREEGLQGRERKGEEGWQRPGRWASTGERSFNGCVMATAEEASFSREHS